MHALLRLSHHDGRVPTIISSMLSEEVRQYSQEDANEG